MTELTAPESNTVAVDGFEITSNHESAEEMVKALTPPDKEAQKQPRIIKPIPDKKEPDAKLSKAAAKLGEAGGRASAEARRAQAGSVSDASVSGLSESAGQQDSGAEGDEEASPEKPLGKPRDDPRARMLEATRKESEAKRRAYEAEQRAIAAEMQLQALRQPEQPPEERRPTLPFKPEDFENYEDYLDARDGFRMQQWQIQQQEQAAISAYAAQLDSALGSFHEMSVSAFGENPAEKVSEQILGMQCSAALEPGQPIGPEHVIADEFIALKSPDLMMYLSENDDELQRLAALPTPMDIQIEMRAMARELARQQAKAEAASAGNSVSAKPYIPAKPPVRPVAGTPTTADPFEVSDELSDDEWLRRRMAQQKAQSAR